MDDFMTPAGVALPRLGLGTWRMGSDPARRSAEADALRLGLDLGVRLIDTAEMYHDAESVVGDAIVGRRDDLTIVSKVLPENATFDGTIAACERSLTRLRTDRIDVYLLHWESAHPLEETVRAFERLVADGKIRAWGVSNFDRAMTERAVALGARAPLATNQVLYNLGRRNIEADLLPWCLERSIPIMAYSPFEQGRMPFDGALGTVADRHDATPAQVALAWLLDRGVVAIPKASDPAHVRENVAAASLALTDADRAALDAAYPPPDGPSPLPVL